MLRDEIYCKEQISLLLGRIVMIRYRNKKSKCIMFIIFNIF